ncbi:realted to arylsulfatase [Penicillium soppii]|uniref:realted to arylsulfatase n=1 Tax=Penicillium soppii TaxID=69789 RepID=UPI002548F2FE|nr:realted to arylsulfatase [Penicillium soppii]KAJ5863934.1 realted to arylsulfatase [Penicillium soppii]
MSRDENTSCKRIFDRYECRSDRECLRAAGEWDHTSIVLMSENGAESRILKFIPVLAGLTFGDVIKRYHGPSRGNTVNQNSFVRCGQQLRSAAKPRSEIV